MEEPLKKNIDNNIVNSDSFYSVRRNRVRDILFGIGLGLFYFILSSIIIAIIGDLGEPGIIFIAAFLIFIYLFAVALFFIIKRKYLSIGLIIIVILPVAIFGGCLLIISVVGIGSVN